MSVTQIVRARKAGHCAADFAHPSEIRPGDRTLIVTYLPSDEHVHSFGVKPFTRERLCGWCLERNEAEGWRIYPEPTGRKKAGDARQRR